MAKRKDRQKLMLLAYESIDYTGWSSGKASQLRSITSLPLNVVGIKSHIIMDYETEFDSIGQIEAQVSINIDSDANLADGTSITNLINQNGTDVVMVAWLPDHYDIHFFPMIFEGQTQYSTHIMDIYLPMASNDIEYLIRLRDGLGGTTNPVATGLVNFWILLEVEVL